jgi:hypothetical protein
MKNRGSFVPKWSDEQIETARALVDEAPTKTRGYASAADYLGITEDAARKVVSGRNRGPRKRATQSPAPLPTYAARVEARADRSRVASLERENHELRLAVDAYSSATKRPLAPVKRYELGSGLREATSVAMLSDVHCEEAVRAGETPTGNEYNPEIAEKSIARFFAGYRWLIEFHRNAFQIRHALLWLGGDLMTGHIHEELKETTASTPIETMLWLRSRIVSGIDLLLEDDRLDRLLIPCSYGNHGRDTKKSFRAQGAAHSYEWALYQWLAHHYAGNRRVEILADQSAHQYVQVYDFNLHFHHGDETNYGGGVGGITIPLNKAVAQWDIARRCDYHHFGHWHQYIDTGRIVVNGSVIGYNAFAMAIKAAPEPPQQAFYLLDAKRGKTCKSPIWVRERA